MRYTMTPGGFAAVDDERRLGAFAYRTSDRWMRAKREPELVAKLMLDIARSVRRIPGVDDEHYLRVCEHFKPA